MADIKENTAEEDMHEFIRENFRQMHESRAPNGWRYLYLSHNETNGRVIAQIRDNNQGDFGFQLFVPPTHKRSDKKKFESTIEHLERLSANFIREQKHLAENSPKDNKSHE